MYTTEHGHSGLLYGLDFQPARKLHFLSFNKGEVFIPPEIAEKSIGIDGDIGAAINAIVESVGLPHC